MTGPSTRPATGPITTIAGGLTSSAFATSATVASVARTVRWMRVRAVLHDHDRGLRVAPAGEERLGERLRPLDGHHQHERAAQAGERVPVDEAARIVRARRARDTTTISCATPRWLTGTSAIAGTANALVTPGHDGDGDAGLGAGEHLLEAAAEHVRVAALEPHHELAGAGALDRAAR